MIDSLTVKMPCHLQTKRQLTFTSQLIIKSQIISSTRVIERQEENGAWHNPIMQTHMKDAVSEDDHRLGIPIPVQSSPPFSQ